MKANFILVFILMYFTASLSMAQMKSVEFPDTIPFEPLACTKVRKVPDSLSAQEFRLDTTDGFLEVPPFENTEHLAEFSFYIPRGKRSCKFTLDSRLQFRDIVSISVSSLLLHEALYYEIIFHGEQETSCLADGGGAVCDTYYWIDADRMKVLDFTLNRHEWWNDLDTLTGAAYQSTSIEQAEVAVDDSLITITLAQERFTPEPNYHNMMRNFGFVYRHDPIGWIKESETME